MGFVLQYMEVDLVPVWAFLHDMSRFFKKAILKQFLGWPFYFIVNYRKWFGAVDVSLATLFYIAKKVINQESTGLLKYFLLFCEIPRISSLIEF